MSIVEIDETIPEGRKRFKWPWESLEEIGEFFIVKDPKNIRNGRQSVFQANLKAGFKKFEGGLVVGGYKITKVA